MFRFRKRLAVVSACLLAAVAAAHSSGMARAQPIQVEGTVPLSALSLGGRNDLRLLAERDGISLAEAHRRGGWETDFSLVATKIQDSLPESFSSAELTGRAPAAGTITFKGAVPEAAFAMAARAPVGVTVNLVPGAENSSNEQDELVIRAHHAVTTASVGIAGDELVSEFLPSEGVVEVRVAPLPDASGAERRAVARTISDRLPADLRNQVVVRIDPAVSAAANEGGLRVFADPETAASGRQ